jgi:hypothetical protein
MFTHPLRTASLWLFALAGLCQSVTSAQSPQLVATLQQPILGPDEPLAEVQNFILPRVATLPSFDTWQQRQAYHEQLRTKILDQVVFRGEARAWRDAQTKVEWLEKIPGGPGYQIQKLRYEAIPGLWIPALLYVPDQLTARVPVVLNVNGHDAAGKQAPYKQLRCINQAKRGMLALNVEWLGMGQLRGDNFLHYRANQLDLCGTSGLSLFYLAMSRALDLLLAHEHADPQRVAVAGLSGGGWQTIVISSLDPRVTLANPVAGYSSFVTRARFFSDLGDSEQTPTDLAHLADYTHLTALRAPRPTLLTFNVKDNCCFRADHALQPLWDAAAPAFQSAGAPDRLRWHVNDDPGDHNFGLDNRQALYRALGEFFYPGDAKFSPLEIESESEVKSAEALHVPLPGDNLDFTQIARRLMQTLPQPSSLDDPAWRARLKEILAWHAYEVAPSQVDQSSLEGVTLTRWKLRLGSEWTVPCMELAPADPVATTLVVADAGFTSAAAPIAQLLAQQHRVLAIDPFYFGQSKISQRDFLFALLVSSVGQRPLGLQASQLAAVAHWTQSRHPQPLHITAIGPRASLAALVAQAAEPKLWRSADLREGLTSLKQVIDNNWSVDTHPELFCFGLLEFTDIDQLQARTQPK